MTWTSSQKIWTAAFSLTSAAVGGAVGFVVAQRMLEAKFQEQLEAELQESRAYFQQMYSTPVFEAEKSDDDALLEDVRDATDEVDGMPEDVVGRALTAISTYNPEDPEETVEVRDRKDPVIINTFDHHTPPGDEVLGALMADRDISKPYIITKTEYYENEPDHEQVPFTYWEGDDILVNDRDEFNPIENQEAVAGEENLLRFGYGSGDEDILYIRNEAMNPPMDLCITKSTGKYAVEVMAIDEGPHLEHTHRKMRRWDDE